MSFWSTIGSSLGSLIPGIGPFLGPAIGLGLGAAFGGGSGAQNSGGQASSALTGNINDVLSNGSPTPQSQQASKYYSTILNGNRQATQALLNPQVSTVLGQYDSAAKAAAELGPRGGGRTEQMAEIPTKKVGVYENALDTAQPQAAKGLTDLSSQNNGLISSLLGARSSANQLGFEQTQAINQQLGGLGSGIGSILVNLLKGKGGTGGTGGFGSLSTNDSGGSIGGA